MKWKLNRRQQFIAGQDTHALPVASLSLASTLLIERIYINVLLGQVNPAVRNIKTGQCPHSFSLWQTHILYAYCIYQDTPAQTWSDVDCKNIYSHNVPSSPSHSDWQYCSPNPCRYHLQVHVPTLSTFSVCLKQEMRWASAAKNNSVFSG